MSAITWDDWIDADETRHHMTKPFPYKKKAMATNGHHIIIAEFEDAFDEGFLTENKRHHDVISTAFCKWTKPKVSEWIKLKPMEFIAAHGKCEACGRGHMSKTTCWHCEDTTLEERQSITVGNYVLNKEYFCKISNLQNAKIAATANEMGHVRFTADNAIGLVMGMRAEYEIHEILEIPNDQ